MTWLICWISRKRLHLPIPMISSTLQHLSPKTCGLFDSGFAGNEDVIASVGVNHPADALSDFALDSFDSSLGPADQFGSKNNYNLGNKVDNWSVLDDFDNLSADPLGDDSMETFINLDKFLSGNSFFDEDGNLTVPEQEEEVVDPIISFDPVTVTKPETLDFNQLLLSHPSVQPVVVQPPRVVKATGKPRKPSAAAAREGVKTSMFEIPVLSALMEESDPELDHDYTPKRQRKSSVSGNADCVINATIEDTLTHTQAGPSKACVDDAKTSKTLDKQSIRRIKNNYASKRSREQRKQKFVEMDMEAEELVIKNQKLREKITELEKIAKEMKAVLVAKMAGKH